MYFKEVSDLTIKFNDWFHSRVEYKGDPVILLNDILSSSANLSPYHLVEPRYSRLVTNVFFIIFRNLRLLYSYHGITTDLYLGTKVISSIDRSINNQSDLSKLDHMNRITSSINWLYIEFRSFDMNNEIDNEGYYGQLLEAIFYRLIHLGVEVAEKIILRCLEEV